MTQGTPMLRQYLGIKEQYPDAILFFRMGDFYEMFFEDAETASRILGITLTSRGTHNGRKIPMCGVPYHAARSYLGKLVAQGLKVAICDQVEDPRAAKGIVRREVTRVVTPGTGLDEAGGEGPGNVFMAAVASEPGRWGLAHLDLSTGEFRVTETADREELFGELARIDPAEVLIPDADPVLSEPDLSGYRVERLDPVDFDRRRASILLKEQLGVHSLDGFGCRSMPQGIVAAGAVVHYLRKTQKASPAHVKDLVTYHLGGYMFLDETTTRNLELFRTIRRDSGKGTLLHVLDRDGHTHGSATPEAVDGLPPSGPGPYSAQACGGDEPLRGPDVEGVRARAASGNVRSGTAQWTNCPRPGQCAGSGGPEDVHMENPGPQRGLEGVFQRDPGRDRGRTGSAGRRGIPDRRGDLR